MQTIWRENQPNETKPELAQMSKLADKNIKIVIITKCHVLKS